MLKLIAFCIVWLIASTVQAQYYVYSKTGQKKRQVGIVSGHTNCQAIQSVGDGSYLVAGATSGGPFAGGPSILLVRFTRGFQAVNSLLQVARAAAFTTYRGFAIDGLGYYTLAVQTSIPASYQISSYNWSNRLKWSVTYPSAPNLEGLCMRGRALWTINNSLAGVPIYGYNIDGTTIRNFQSINTGAGTLNGIACDANGWWLLDASVGSTAALYSQSGDKITSFTVASGMKDITLEHPYNNPQHQNLIMCK